MSETQNTGESQQSSFRPSTPDLTPNLEGNMDGYHADRNRANAASWQEGVNRLRQEEGFDSYFIREKGIGELHESVADVYFMLGETLPDQPTGTMEDAALRYTLAVLKEKLTKLRNAGVDAEHARVFKEQGGQHYRGHREAYENQAVIDYTRAREADPESYPEPLKYGQTDQSTSETPPEDQDSNRE